MWWIDQRLTISNSFSNLGKQCFFVIREQQDTVQCLGFVNERISKQMVKFISHISKESIVDVQAEVVKAAEKIESCTQQNIELHVHQVIMNTVEYRTTCTQVIMYTAEYSTTCTPGNYEHSIIQNYI